MKIIAASLLVSAILLTGCETTSVLPGEAEAVPASNVYGFKTPTVPGSARIVFTQDAGAFSCFGAGMKVYLDGVLAAETSHGQTVTLYHPPGPAQLSIKNNAMCAGGALSGLLLELKPGYSYQVRGYRGMWDKPEALLSAPPPYAYRK